MKTDINKIEEKILNFWKSRNIFQKSLENRKGDKRFVFFEGPPTANAKPGIHHFLGRAFKDLFARYKTMRGYFVLRKAGWDTHGLPVEIEVEKELGLKTKKEIEKYGIEKFNKKAKENIWKYKEEWESLTKRIGFWLDLNNPYITYDKNYIETLWWIIKEINKKKLLYEGHKVLPWCPRCGTALSSHEVAQGYKTVTDRAVTVKFLISKPESLNKLKIQNSNSKTYILSWTTTPWTLPGNVALAVGPSIKYQVLRIKDTNEIYVLAADRVDKILNTEFEILNTISGKELVDLEYKPLFNVSALKSPNSYKIYPADFVTTEEGTGVVHTAVMYGEDDYKLGEKYNLPMHHTVDEFGKFTKDVLELRGGYVKDSKTEDQILNYLKENNLLLREEEYSHDYPFCWRCKSPLLYYAKNSWFVAMSKLRSQLIKNNKKINWIPDHLREGRFGEFLREVKDWAFSRERYWGTPLPVWKCGGCENNLIVGSYEELHKNAYRKPNTYYYMRHGISEKNDHEILSSRIETDKYHLTKEGREEVKKEANKLKRKGGVDLIFCSPFIRTKETAGIAGKILKVNPTTDNRLHELDHGSMCEGKSYYVCIPKGHNPSLNFKFGDGESWMDVKKRTSDLLKELNNKYEGKKILLVGHGDPLAILESITEQTEDGQLLKILAPSLSDYGIKEKLFPKKGKIKKLNFRYAPYDEFGYLDPHRPYIDEVELKCPKCKGKMKRVSEVIDAWFDSGAMPLAQWHYPFENKDKFKDNFPADFIGEGIDQTRGWFYTLLSVATLLGRGAPYKNVISYSHVLDEKGKKMSKSLGNTVDPWDVIKNYGSDATRWYFYTVNSPGDYKLFAMKDVGTRLFGFVMTLLNSLRFLNLYYGGNTNSQIQPKPKELLDSWILSRLNNLIDFTTKEMDNYNLTSSARAIETFVVYDLSNWWIRRSRQRFQKPQNKEEIEYSVNFLKFMLFQVSKLIAPFTPLLAEEIYLQIHKGETKAIESVHLQDWPKSNKKLVNKELEKEMEEIRRVAAEALAQRKEQNIKVRQPLSKLTLKNKINPKLQEYLKEEVNVKEIFHNPKQEEEIVLNATLTRELIIEGYVRELIRKIQDMRKEAGYKFNEKVFALWSSADKEVGESIAGFEEQIKEDTLLKLLERKSHTHIKQSFDVEREFEIVPGKKIWLGIWK